MAANMDALIRIAARVDGANTIQAFSRDLKGLDGAARLSTTDLGRMNIAINRMAREAGNTTSGIRAHIGALENLRSRVDIGSKAYNRLGNEIDQLRGKLRGLDGNVERSKSAFSGLGGALAGLGVAAAAIQASRFIIGKTSELETQTRSIQTLTGSLEQSKQIIGELQQLGAATPFTSTELVESSKKLIAFGVDAEKVVETTRRLGDIAGATGANIGELSVVYGQVMAKGRLQGEELLQFQERGVGLQDELRKMYGLTGEEFSKALEKGQISAKAVEIALQRLTDTGGKYANGAVAQSTTLAGRFSTLTDGIETLSRTIGTALSPAIRGVLNEALFAINTINGLIATGARANGFGMSQQQRQRVLQQAQSEAEQIVNGRRIQDPFERNRQLQEVTRQRERDLIEAYGLSTGQIKAPTKAPAASQALPPLGSGEEERKKAAKDAEKERKKAAKEAQQLAEEAAKARIELDNTLHRNAIELIRKRYEYERELQNQSADNWVKRYTGAARSAAGIISGALRGFDDLTGRQREADVGVLNARQALGSAQRQGAIRAAAGGGLGMANFTASQLQAATKEASRFTGVANMCSESVKAFYKSLGITLPGVTAWADTVRKAGKTMTDWSQLRPGDIVATGRPGDTPHVGVYTGGDSVFHQSRSRGLKAGNFPDLSYFKRGGYFVRPSAMAGAGAPAGPSAAGDTMQAGANLAQAQALAALEKGQIEKLKASIGEGFVLDFTDQLRQQNAELENQNAITQLRNRLQMEGVRPEIIDAEAQKAQKFREVAQEIGVATDALKTLEVAGQGGSEQANRLREAIALQNENLLTFKARTDEATAAQIAFNDAMRFRQDSNVGAGLREGAQGYIESIGTMREASAQLAQNGIGGIENALTSLATTGKANFREFAVDMLKQTARLIIQQVVLRTVLQAVGAIGGAAAGGGGGITGNIGSVNFNPAAFSMPSLMSANGNAFAQNGIQAFAMGGIVNSPTLFKFAQGGAMRNGVMGEAGPEAIMPLRRLPGGRLGVEAAGGNTSAPISVVVHVDAKGSRVEGNQTEGAQLGRAISAAVKAELVKQQRPGGILAGDRR